jgi:hypothetical protein
MASIGGEYLGTRFQLLAYFPVTRSCEIYHVALSVPDASDLTLVARDSDRPTEA